MAADFTALFGHDLTWEQIETLTTRLNECWSGEVMTPGARNPFQPAWAYHPSDHLYHSLESEFRAAGHLVLKGPDGFDGQVFRRIFELYNWTRWWSFVSEPAVTTALCQTCRMLAEVLGTRTVIY